MTIFFAGCNGREKLYNNADDLSGLLSFLTTERIGYEGEQHD
jgi:hypothetical protein